MTTPRSTDFQYVTAAIAEADSRMLHSIGSCLLDMGFSHVIESPSVGGLHDTIESGKIDLLIVDNDTSGGDACGLTRGIRNQEVGKNPFIVVINLIDEKDKAGAALSINSGADELIAKPFAAGTLMDQITGIAEKRKKFVITSNYIGPTRRKAARPDGTHDGEFEVPNPVKARVNGLDAKKLWQEIYASSEQLSRRRRERDTLKIAEKAREAVRRCKTGAAPANDEYLATLSAAIDDVIGRFSADTKAEFRELCLLMKVVVVELQAGPEKSIAKDLRALDKLAEGFSAAFNLAQ